MFVVHEQNFVIRQNAETPHGHALTVFVHKVASTSAVYRAWRFRIIDQIYYLQLLALVLIIHNSLYFFIK